jgi:hypothetical protein
MQKFMGQYFFDRPTSSFQNDGRDFDEKGTAFHSTASQTFPGPSVNQNLLVNLFR